MPTLNFHTKAQRRNVINMPSREPAQVTAMHREHCPHCAFVATARSYRAMTLASAHHYAWHEKQDDGPEAA